MPLPWLLDSGHAVPGAMIVLAALALDAAFGEPAGLYRRVPHPVAAIGWAIGRAEARLNRPGRSDAGRFARGLALTLAMLAAAAAIGSVLAAATRAIPGGWLVEAALASTLIAARSLDDHVRAVAAGLDAGLAEGRAAVAHIVGRDPAALDRAGVARAAVESAAENFSDAVVAPVVWYALLGLPGLVAYKTLNTLDSMIGHRDARYAMFGKAAARLDDVANWPAARLAGLLVAGAALVLPRATAAGAFVAMRRDARRHRSPNAGWPEAAVAGALGFALAGPRRYGGRVVDDAWMGDGRADLDAADIRAALGLCRAAWLLLVLAIATLAVA